MGQIYVYLSVSSLATLPGVPLWYLESELDFWTKRIPFKIFFEVQLAARSASKQCPQMEALSESNRSPSLGDQQKRRQSLQMVPHQSSQHLIRLVYQQHWPDFPSSTLDINSRFKMFCAFKKRKLEQTNFEFQPILRLLYFSKFVNNELHGMSNKNNWLLKKKKNWPAFSFRLLRDN